MVGNAQYMGVEIMTDKLVELEGEVVPLKDLEKVERKLDDFNAQNGTSGNLCLFCHASQYDGKHGIIHSPECVILLLRRAIVAIPRNTKSCGYSPQVWHIEGER